MHESLHAHTNNTHTRAHNKKPTQPSRLQDDMRHGYTGGWVKVFSPGILYSVAFVAQVRG